jgi:transcriptional antiterminator NusG
MNANEPEIKQTEGNMENATPVSTDGAESVLKKAAEDMAKWFVIHSQTGHEARVKTALEQRIVSLGMEHKIFQVVIPTREIVVVKKGKKTKQKERVFPGYILIKMIMDDDSWLVVRTTEGVTGFIGASPSHRRARRAGLRASRKGSHAEANTVRPVGSR